MKNDIESIYAELDFIENIGSEKFLNIDYKSTNFFNSKSFQIKTYDPMAGYDSLLNLKICLEQKVTASIQDEIDKEYKKFSVIRKKLIDQALEKSYEYKVLMDMLYKHIEKTKKKKKD